VADVHNDENLDWNTYKALRQAVSEKRLELIAERELPGKEEWEKSLLLTQQIACTDIGARMLEVMQRDLDRRYPQKES
jgi:hypothetical protein